MVECRNSTILTRVKDNVRASSSVLKVTASRLVIIWGGAVEVNFHSYITVGTRFANSGTLQTLSTSLPEKEPNGETSYEAKGNRF
jgi:hypothetical protein